MHYSVLDLVIISLYNLGPREQILRVAALSDSPDLYISYTFTGVISLIALLNYGRFDGTLYIRMHAFSYMKKRI